jgi:hypothetical protein
MVGGPARFHLDGVGSALSWQRAVASVRPVRLGFLGESPFRCEDPCSRGLDFP